MRDKLVVWPNYIDAQKSKKEGRKISRKDAIDSPTLGEIHTAAEKLGAHPVAERDKAYPRGWWGAKGRILIEKTKQKNKALREIAREIRRMRK